jgi:hypothetical protein
MADKLLGFIRAGAYLETAAAAAGISKDTLYAWLREGARGKTPELAAFSDAVEKAAAEAELRDLLTIGKAAAGGEVLRDVTITRPDGTTQRERQLAPPQWQAAAWRLERKFPDRYGVARRIRAEVERELEGVLDRLQEALSEAELAKVLAALAADTPGEDPPGAPARRYQ